MLLKYPGRFDISLATMVGGSLLILLPLSPCSSNFLANMRECMAKASSGDSAGGTSPARGEGRSLCAKGILGGSKASLLPSAKFKLAGRGPIVKVLELGAGRNAHAAVLCRIAIVSW